MVSMIVYKSKATVQRTKTKYRSDVNRKVIKSAIFLNIRHFETADLFYFIFELDMIV